MTALLAVMLASALALTYATLRATARDTAEARLERAAHQLRALAETSSRRLEAQIARAATDSALRRALVQARDGDSVPRADVRSAARLSLERLLGPRDSAVTIELWSSAGRRVAFAGADIRARRATPRASGAEGIEQPSFEGADDALAAGDSARLGALYLVDGIVHFWIVAPVLEEGERIGVLARQYRLDDGGDADETIRALTGSEVVTYYRNVDGALWTTIGGRPSASPAASDTIDGDVIVTRAGVGELLSVEEPIAGTPLVLVLEMPLRAALAGPLGTISRLALLSLLLLLVGALAAWVVSRRITRPLVSLTGAAEAVAAGDYGVRVPEAGDEELARLAASFNRMASQVGTTQGELEEREAQFRALADSIPQLSWMADATGFVFWYNQRWQSYTGLTQDELHGDGWVRVHDPAILPRVVERWRASIETGTRFEMEFPLRGADGHWRWFLTRVEPVRDREGRVVRWFGTNTDVQILREARDAAEAARHDAEKANRAKSDFLAVMSHELRTPLNAIGGYVELLEMGIRGPVTDVQRRDLARIRASQQHLLGLIGGLLDMSRIEAGRVTYVMAPVLVDPFLAGLEELVAPQAAAKSLVLEHVPCAPGLAVVADREKLRQIMLNLLSNAIRYTPPGGRITLAAESRGGDLVAITTRDTGIGIAAEALEHIFEPFVQLDRSLTRVRDGVGLGLAISRDLARGMGGEITAESTPGAGAVFTLSLPRATVADGEGIVPRTGEYSTTTPQPAD
jgi:PAS domain S-box-containing protein